MSDADSCDSERVVERGDGATRPPIPYGGESRWEEGDFEPPSGDDRCHDCGVLAGALHHPGCDMEECPFCGGQYLACACSTNENSRRLVSEDWFDPDDPIGSLDGAQDESGVFGE
jgi:hypothetical protein